MGIQTAQDEGLHARQTAVQGGGVGLQAQAEESSQSQAAPSSPQEHKHGEASEES
jgi:hypothetical protein